MHFPKCLAFCCRFIPTLTDDGYCSRIWGGANRTSGPMFHINNQSNHFYSGVKKSKNIHLSPGQVHQNFYLFCYQITCPCQGKDKQALNFLLVRWTLGENICLSCLKFNLSRAPGQVIFLPLLLYYLVSIFIST